MISYIVDTGINIHHPDFEGRAVWGTTIPKFDRDVDGNGHGTHCAGTIGSKTYGIAKNAILKAVKVLRSNGSGSLSDVTKGIQWVINDYTEALKKDNTTRATANMSLGGGTSRVLDMIVNAAVRAGIHFAVAAGNENAPACGTSPGRAELPVTVGATDVKDRRAEFSNYGEWCYTLVSLLVDTVLILSVIVSILVRQGSTSNPPGCVKQPCCFLVRPWRRHTLPA